MQDKLAAGLVAAIVVAPVCAVCILGPAVLASVLAGITGWIGGLDPVLVAGLAILAGIAVYGIVRRRNSRPAQASRLRGISR